MQDQKPIQSPSIIAGLILCSFSIFSCNSNPTSDKATNGTTWTQQGDKLVGTGAVGTDAHIGSSVAISSDGNTAIVGGFNDDNGSGAAWVWTRSSGVWTPQGNKLVGTGAIGPSGGTGPASQGYAVSISADGNTTIIGGPGDSGGMGAAWVWARVSGVWTQQGTKLVGTGTVGGASQGSSVSLSSDGNTAIIGGPSDNFHAGAAWVWTRSDGIWTQQGGKLVGTGAVGNAVQGGSVSISSDGNTAIVGGFFDDNFAGAAWVWTRSGGVWTQQGDKLVGSGATTSIDSTSGSVNRSAQQGRSVSLSSDGNTAIVGGPDDSTYAGAAWVWTRSGGVWNQQGSKLVGTGPVGAAWQGGSVALSYDGNTVIIGGVGDNGGAGTAWMWTRTAGVWTQHGSKLVGTGAVGGADQGYSVSLSADGNTVMVGGPGDNGGAGAAWVWTQE